MINQQSNIMNTSLIHRLSFFLKAQKFLLLALKKQNQSKGVALQSVKAEI